MQSKLDEERGVFFFFLGAGEGGDFCQGLSAVRCNYIYPQIFQMIVKQCFQAHILIKDITW